jgi:D-alanine transaminase
VDLCSLNGRILPLAEAHISPLDRGLVFGDGLYEVIKARDGVLLHLERHLQRLRTGLARVDIGEPPGLAESCAALVAATELGTGSLFIQVTRGAAPRGHLPPADLVPTVIIVPSEHAFDPPAGRRMAAITMLDPRWRHCDLKTTSLMGTVLGKLAVRDAGADEVVFVSGGGELREGGSTSLFVRRDDTLETHPLDGRVLPSITRGVVLGLAAEAGFEVVERAPRMAHRSGWSEAFLCGTLTGLQPVVRLDGQPVGDGEPGPWTRQLAEARDRLERELVAAAGAGGEPAGAVARTGDDEPAGARDETATAGDEGTESQPG